MAEWDWLVVASLSNLNKLGHPRLNNRDDILRPCRCKNNGSREELSISRRKEPATMHKPPTPQDSTLEVSVPPLVLEHETLRRERHGYRHRILLLVHGSSYYLSGFLSKFTASCSKWNKCQNIKEYISLHKNIVNFVVFFLIEICSNMLFKWSTKRWSCENSSHGLNKLMYVC